MKVTTFTTATLKELEEAINIFLYCNHVISVQYAVCGDKFTALVVYRDSSAAKELQK
jgi:hypothetical protein